MSEETKGINKVKLSSNRCVLYTRHKKAPAAQHANDHAADHIKEAPAPVESDAASLTPIGSGIMSAIGEVAYSLYDNIMDFIG